MQSSQNELSSAIRKYGQLYATFLQQYPTISNRETPIVSTLEAVRRGGRTLATIDNICGAGASETWLKCMLVDLFVFLGAFDVANTSQFKGIAMRIRHEYYHLTPSELTCFFYKFSMGDYGKLYAGRSVNPQDILIGLKNFMADLYEQRANVFAEELAEKQRKEAVETKKNAITYEEYCRRKGKDVGESPLTQTLNDIINKSKQ